MHRVPHPTRFPLTGAHATKPTCAQCHTSGVYTGTPANCDSCHLKDYNNPANAV
ncbi:MAG: hypothetical protein HY013_21650, partial [Candidatus Solibacter usitatus]|nr:hypothetical protein [Candidatus Solibacter usitatus]